MSANPTEAAGSGVARALLTRHEFHGDAVHAVAQAGRRRAVLEDMAEMAAAAAAVHLGAGHEPAVVHGRADRVVDWRPEARPAGAALILGLGGVQGQLAAGADECPGALLSVQRACAGALGAVLAQHVELLRRQPLAPLRLAVGDLEDLRGLSFRACPTEPPHRTHSRQAGDGHTETEPAS